MRKLAASIALLATLTGCGKEVSSPSAYAEVEKLFISGDLRAAEKLAISTLDHRPAEQNSCWQAAMRVELGKVYVYEGKSDLAKAALSKDQSAECGPDLIAHRHLFLALAEARIGDLAGARHDIQIAGSTGGSDALQAELISAKGSIALGQSHLREAGECFRQALSMAREHGLTFVKMQSEMNLGVIALEEERYLEAKEYFQDASDLARSLGARQALEKSLGNLGRTYLKSGDFVRALRLSNAAAEDSARLGATVDEIQWLTNAGLSSYEDGDYASARLSFEKALASATSIHDASSELTAHISITYLMLKERRDVADAHLRRASQLAHDGVDRSEDSEVLLLESLFALQHGNATEAESALLKIVHLSGSAPSLQWEAENTLATLYDRTERPREAERWYKRAIDTFHRQRLTLKSVELELPFLENGSDLYMGYMEHLIRAGRTGEALDLLDASRAETLREGLGTAPRQTAVEPDSRAVAARLHATVLVYCLRPERSYLWAVTGGKRRFYTLPGSATILPLVGRHNEAILGAKDLLARQESTGRRLYDALLAPAAELLPKDGGRVVLVADSALSRLNFETLIAPGPSPHFWLEDVSVTNARSLRLLAAAGQARQPPGTREPKMLLIGDPVYADGEYAPLPNAAAEMAGIAGHFAEAERVVARREEASPTAYAANRPGRFRFLHFVAHATASELNPLDSAVILSGGAGATNKLYANEILKRPLSAELVTLSSCYSSGTRNYTGEGVVGLAWAFLRAGAHSVIGSLWEVSDLATPKLMDTLYTRLLAGSSPDAALREAKLEMLRGGGVYRKPIYWAAFQLYAGR